MKSIAPLLIGGAMIAMAFVWVNRPRPAPPPALDSAALAKSDSAPTLLELGAIIEQAAAGDDVAQNNLAIIAMRSPRGLIEVDPDALLEAAAAQGNMAARYNLALRIPNKHGTDPALTKRRIELLRPNAEAGDPHSQMLLARTLYFVNRDALVHDRAGLRLEMFRRAALSGDIDYRLAYAKDLYANFATTKDPAQWHEVAAILHDIYKDRDGRGAEYLGFMLRSGMPARPADADALPSYDPIYWYRAAADTGLAPALCNHGLQTFRFVETIREDRKPQPGARIRQKMDQMEPEARAAALSDLKRCAELDKNTPPSYLDRTRNKAFGAPSVYRRKLSGGWPTLGNLNAAGAYLLGLMYLDGFAVAQDRAQAKAYLGRAVDMGNHAAAKSVLDDMQGN